MNDQQHKTERQIEKYFAAELEQVSAPDDLWSRVERRLPVDTHRSRGSRLRLPAFAATATIAVVLGVGAWIAVDRLGGDPSRSGSEVLAAALEAAEHPESVGLQSFHGIAEFTHTAPLGGSEPNDDYDSEYEGVVRAEIPEEAGVSPEEASMEIWFGAPDRYRIEHSVPASARPPAVTVIVTDGTTTWFYDSISNSFESAPADAPEAGEFRLVLRPESGAASIEELLTHIQGEPHYSANLTGEETLAGRRVYVVEVSPAWTSSGPEGEQSGGVIRFWIDREYLFALGWQITDEDGGVLGLQFRDVEFNGDINDAVFRFEPPPGATESDSPGSLGTSFSSGGSESGDLGHDINVPSGFLAPEYFPRGYQARSVGESFESDAGGNEETYQVDFLIRDAAGDGYISAQERRGRGDVPDALKRGDEVDVLGNDAWLWTEDGLFHLAWQDDDVVVYMIARELSADELRRVAESMIREELPAGTLIPGYVPPGYEYRDFNNRQQTYFVEYTGPGFLRLQVNVRQGQMPDFLKQGELVHVSGREAWLSETENNSSLAWMDGEQLLFLEASDLAREELLRMADSIVTSTAEGGARSSEALPVLP